MSASDLTARGVAILEDLRDNGATTVDAFVHRQALYVNSWAPEFTALRKAGLIARTGERVSTVAGALAFVLTITEAGRKVLRD